MVALVDCNNFYASCERVFNPKLEGKPIVVLSNNDGCVIARSQEAKDMGIAMGAPAFLMKAQLANVAVFSSNYTLYGDLSDRVMRTLSQFSPQVEVYSIDEIFLNFDKMPPCTLQETYARNIKETVHQHIGIPVSIGIAPTKTLAKMANRFAKKNRSCKGVFVLDNAQSIESVLKDTAVDDIWGVGRQHSSLLKMHQIFTAFDFAHAPPAWVRKNLSVVGLRIQAELNGMACLAFDELPAAKQAICTSRSFGQMLTNKAELQAAIATHAASCAQKLRRQQSCAGLINVFIHTNVHRTQDEQYFRSVNIAMPVPCNASTQMVRYAMQGLEQIFKPGFKYKKAGVIVLEIVPETQVQQALFDTVDRTKHSNLMKALDGVNHTYGKHIVKFAIQGNGEKWKLRQEHLSPCYTTRLSDVLKIG